MNTPNNLEKESFESSLKRVEEVIAELERGDLPLEQSLARYEEGMARLNRCYSILDSVEKKIALLSKKENGTVQESPFNPDMAKNIKR
jgi:exodeoxyribonuclease VII small subunit